jgi:hypothetical protein
MLRALAPLTVVVCLVGFACGSSKNGTVTVTVAPATANVLTCGSQVFTATVTGASDVSVAWSIDPATVGSIDATGTYAAPIATPAPPAVEVFATSHADATAKKEATVTLATAFPSASKMITGSTAGTSGVFPHSIAAKGMRVYSVWGGPESTTPQLMVSRSDDGGATWAAPVAAISLTLIAQSTDMDDFGPNDNASCSAIAIDAGDPDVVYVYGRISHENDLGDAATGPGGGVTAFLAVSTDGAATFHTTVMQVGGTAGGPNGGWDSPGICGDVISPAANAVIVEAPGGYNGDGNPDIAIWADSARGAGFATGMASPGDYLAAGYTDALDNLLGNHDIAVSQNGGTDEAGGQTESPRLFTDGAGRVCVTYYGSTFPGSDTQSHVYVQCSADMARTFSAPLVVDPAQPLNEAISSPVGAFGAGGKAAVLWTTQSGKLMLATSTDGARTFGTPASVPLNKDPAGNTAQPINPTVAYDADGILWIAYVEDTGSAVRVVVDKSCDSGTTWSGSVLVNGPEGSITNMQFPAFALTPTGAPGLVATAADHLAYFTLAP